MNGLHSIGELARLTGLTVKTIRAWSDRGLLPIAARTHVGHRRYDAKAVARVELVKTLRDLGIGLSTIGRIVGRQVALADVAKAHADALAIQIRTLQRRQAVLAAMAGDLSTEEMTMMYELTCGDEYERQKLIRDFLDDVFGGLADPAFEGIRQTWTPVLPAEPDATQREAYAGLAELARDRDFRRTMRRSAEMFAEDRARSGIRIAHPDVVTLARQGRAVSHPGLADRLAAAADPRRHRYESLLATVNGWAGDPGPAA